MNIRVCLISASLVFGSFNAVAQEEAAKPNGPTIGLVLQGGGALGLAHVGVITWLEEHHEMAKLPPLLGSGVYLLAMYEAAQIYGQPPRGLNKAYGFPTDGTVGLIVNKIFGPVEAAYAYGDSGHHNFLFRIGRLF